MAIEHKNRDTKESTTARTSRSTTSETGRPSHFSNEESLDAGAQSSALRRREFRHDWGDQLARNFNSWALGASGNRIGDWDMWSPQVETFQRGDQFVVRVDLPGLKKDDVQVEVTDDSVIIQGERRNEAVDEREGYYRSERSYGSFYRAIPLPEGAIGDNAQATFKDGVLEIAMPAPPQEAARWRRIAIDG